MTLPTNLGTRRTRGGTTWHHRFEFGRNLISYFAILGLLFSLFLFTGNSTAQAQEAVSFGSVADARVLAMDPNANNGSLSRLDVDNPGEASYIRFTLSGLSGTIQNATLRLYVTNGSSNGPSLYATDNSWTESGITWNNRPAPTSGALANVDAAPAGS